jgi:hypothetical protein
LFALFAVSSLNVRGGRVSPVVSLPIIVQPLCFGVKAGGFRPFEASYFSHPCAPATLGRKPIIGISILLRRNVSTKESVTPGFVGSIFLLHVYRNFYLTSFYFRCTWNKFSEPFGPYVEACTIPVSVLVFRNQNAGRRLPCQTFYPIAPAITRSPSLDALVPAPAASTHYRRATCVAFWSELPSVTSTGSILKQLRN